MSTRCPGPDCLVVVEQKHDVGRPRVYCSTRCRSAAYRVTDALRREHALDLADRAVALAIGFATVLAERQAQGSQPAPS
jgi:hypothetical protein